MFNSKSIRLVAPLALAQLLTVVSGQSSRSLSISASASITAAATLPSSSGANSSASSSGAQVHTVSVGNGGFRFDPQELTDVHAGDTVTFEFYPPDHSVARAEFGSACVPYEYLGGKGKVGFFSGQKIFNDPQNPVQWNLTINSTEPIFYYCTAPGSCKDQLMVGVINPNDTQTLDDQIESAKKADFMVAPGGTIPSEGSATLHLPDATTSPTAAPANDHHGHKLSGGAIAGIVVGAVAFLIVSAALFFYIGRAKSLKDILKRNDATVKSTPGAPGAEFGSPGYPPFSPHHSQADYSNLPRYSQHQATDGHPSGWASPTMHPAHMSMSPQPQMGEVKPEQYAAPAEMASPGPTQQTFTAELEAPIKSPR